MVARETPSSLAKPGSLGSRSPGWYLPSLIWPASNRATCAYSGGASTLRSSIGIRPVDRLTGQVETIRDAGRGMKGCHAGFSRGSPEHVVQPRRSALDDLVDRQVEPHRHARLVRGQRFERGLLRVHQRCRHEVINAPTHTLAGDLEVTVEMNEHRPRCGLTKNVAVQAAKRGARHDGAVLLSEPRADPAEPRQPIGVGQRGSACHQRLRLLTVKVVAVGERHGEPFGKCSSDGRLTGTGNAHDHHQGCRLFGHYWLSLRRAWQIPRL